MQALKILLCISILLVTIACDKETVTPVWYNYTDTLTAHERDSIEFKKYLDKIKTFPAHAHGKIDTLIYHGDAMVNFVWVAWDSTDLTLSVEMLEEFFSTIEPFATYKHLFNSYIVYHRLGDRMHEYDPFLDENPTIERMRKDSLVDFILAASAINRGQAYPELQFAYFKREGLQLMAHEIGHLFGLGDEYLHEASTTIFGMEEFRKFNYPNIDTVADETKVKWRHFIGLEGYEAVGVFEGAFYYAEGFYRPEVNSIMRMDGDVLEFNAPSREVIVKKIYEIVGLEYSFDEFIKNDRF